jgi:hypothetical protein
MPSNVYLPGVQPLQHSHRLMLGNQVALTLFAADSDTQITLSRRPCKIHFQANAQR